MNYLSTMHSHCTYCDGKNSPAEMAEAAYKLGFVSYGFSSHSHLPYKAGYEMKMEREKYYRQEVLSLKEEYDGKMEILLGLELDGDSVYPDYCYDYLISSVHQLHINEAFYPVDHSAENFGECVKAFGGIKNMAKAFYDATVAAALRENIDVVGHIDLIGKFNETHKYFDPNDDWYLSLARNTIDQILINRPDIFFEVNTGAISRGYRTTPYPDVPILKYLAEKGAKLILCSDTHAADTIDCAYTEAADYIKAAGFDFIYRLRKNGCEKIEL